MDPKLTLPEDLNLTLPSLGQCYVKCVFNEDDSSEFQQISEPSQNGVPQPLSVTPVYFTDIISARVLCEGENVKTKVEVFLNVKDLELNYLPGDSIGIIPENPKNEVDELIKLLGLDKVADVPVTISLIGVSSLKKLPSYIPSHVTTRNLLTSCLDLRNIVKKGFIRVLTGFTSEATEKRRLEELCSREGSVEYKKEVLDKSTCLTDILQTFPSCKPPLSLLVEHLPRLMPRAYSIASSPLEHPHAVRIVFNLIKDIKGRRGICTGWMYKQALGLLDLTTQFESLELTPQKEKPKIPIFLRKSTKFRIPENPTTPLIMIGPGAGLAPFVGFLEHRSKQLEGTGDNNFAENILLFGCRYSYKDYIYKKNLQHYSDKHVLSKLLVSFSRENCQKEGLKYVQHLFQKEKSYLINLLYNNDRTHLFICGDAQNMAKDVQDVILSSLVEVTGMSNKEAIDYLQSMEKEGKFVKDVWR